MGTYSFIHIYIFICSYIALTTVSTNTSLQQDKYRDSSAYERTGEHPEFFTGEVDDP